MCLEKAFVHCFFFKNSGKTLAHFYSSCNCVISLWDAINVFLLRVKQLIRFNLHVYIFNKSITVIKIRIKEFKIRPYQYLRFLYRNQDLPIATKDLPYLPKDLSKIKSN